MAKIQLTQTGAEVQNDLDLVENIFAQFSTTSTYAVGNVVAYQGHLWKCITAVSSAGAWTGATNWEQTTVETLLGGKINTGGLKTLNAESLEGSANISIPVVEINPTLDGTEGEILGLAINGTKYMTPSLSKTDGVSFAFGSDSNFTFGDSYSSYNRCGNELTFVVACSITKDNATTDPITLGTFSNIPSSLFAKLIPTTVGGNDYLENCDINFKDSFKFNLILSFILEVML